MVCLSGGLQSPELGLRAALWPSVEAQKSHSNSFSRMALFFFFLIKINTKPKTAPVLKKNRDRIQILSPER